MQVLASSSNNVIAKAGRIGIIRAYHRLGATVKKTNEHSKAVPYFFKALQLAENESLNEEMGSIMSSIGWYYYGQGDYPKALEYGFKQLKLGEEIEDEWRIASAYNDIGVVYKRQMQHTKAIAYLCKSVRLCEENGETWLMAIAINNIGDVYSNQGNYPAAADYYLKELQLGEGVFNEELMAEAYECLGNTYSSVVSATPDSLDWIWNKWFLTGPIKKSVILDTALRYQQIALEYYKSTNINYDLSSCLNGIGKTLQLQSKYKKAISTYTWAFELAASNGLLEKEKYAALGLYESYKAIEEFEESLQWLEISSNIKDTIFSSDRQMEVGRLESRYQFELKEAAMILEQEKERAVAISEKKIQQTIIWSVSGGFLLLLAFSVFIFNRFRITQRQKKIITWQKEVVDEKNKEITDSIQYAKRIQCAILPAPKLVRQYLEDSFILYKPKDIVAGDFYWIEIVEDKVFFTSADCTGHGVPGAMVSVMCSNALSKAVKELGIHQPAKILDKTVEILEERFAKSEEEVKDGMDLALCCLNLKTKKLDYAGANNPLYCITRGELKEIKPDKQPIGRYDDRQPYNNHTLDIKTGDCYYIFTDGFADQFGGPKGKKFKYKPFKQLLLDNHDKPMDEQKQLLDKAIEDWRGQLEQVDDICIIGLRI